MVTALDPVKPEPSLYGLVNPETLVNEDSRWISGFEQESVSCMADVHLLDTCNNGANVQVIEASGTGTTGEYLPFTVQATVQCSATGGMRTNWEQRAYDALEQCQSKAIEIEFWEGRLARSANDEDPGSNLNRFLANGQAVDLTPGNGPIKVRYALALIEGKLASAGCGGRGYIHTPVSVASVLPVSDNGNGVLQTPLGNKVIAGDGYTGTGTNGAATTGSQMWIYATGPVFVRLDEPEVAADYPKQSFNTTNNTYTASAERAASVVWDGCAHFKVLVDLSLDYA